MRQVRRSLGLRLRALRKQRAWSQAKLGQRAGLSGKFIGEVERGEKSISVDSLSRVAMALDVPLKELTDIRTDKGKTPSEDAEKLFALLARKRRPDDLRKAYEVLRAMFGES